MHLYVYLRIFIGIAIMARENVWNFRVTTDGTSHTGERKSRTEYVKWVAGQGNLLYEDTFSVEFQSTIGSEHNVGLQDHLRTPNGALKEVTVFAHARSKGGMNHIGERGSAVGIAKMTEGPPRPDPDL